MRRKELRRGRVWLVLFAAVVLAASLGGAALAHGGVRTEVGARVAEILGMDAQTVSDAFSDAIESRAEQALEGRLDRLVAAGRITPQQAEEFQAWFDERPEGFPGLAFGRRGLHRGGYDLSPDVAATLGVDEATVADALAQVARERMEERLEQAVEDGKITQEQADAMLERLEGDGHPGWHGRQWGRRGMHRMDGVH